MLTANTLLVAAVVTPLGSFLDRALIWWETLRPPGPRVATCVGWVGVGEGEVGRGDVKGVM